MLLTVITKDKKIHRTVYRNNIIKIAKSVHKEFPEADYPALHSIITNGIEKQFDNLVLVSGKKIGAAVLKINE